MDRYWVAVSQSFPEFSGIKSGEGGADLSYGLAISLSAGSRSNLVPHHWSISFASLFRVRHSQELGFWIDAAAAISPAIACQSCLIGGPGLRRGSSDFRPQQFLDISSRYRPFARPCDRPCHRHLGSPSLGGGLEHHIQVGSKKTRVHSASSAHSRTRPARNAMLNCSHAACGLSLCCSRWNALSIAILALVVRRCRRP